MTSESCPNGEHCHATLRHYVLFDCRRLAVWQSGSESNVHQFADGVRAGTERCHEAVSKLGQEYDIVVNIQGDEPLLEPEIIDQVVAALQATPDAVYRCTCSACSA